MLKIKSQLEWEINLGLYFNVDPIVNFYTTKFHRIEERGGHGWLAAATAAGEPRHDDAWEVGQKRGE
jgi:hypothetical protein